MPITVSPQQAADRWTQGLSGATQKITDGVNAVTTAPSQKAIAQKQKMITNWTASINNGKWQTNLGKITLQSWQADMVAKGIPRIASGASAANGKMAAFYQQLLPYEQTLQAKIQAMPSVTSADMKARMNAWFDGMTAFKMK